jgi:hypothetical protein
MLVKAGPDVRFNQHLESDGPTASLIPARRGWRHCVEAEVGRIMKVIAAPEDAPGCRLVRSHAAARRP